MAELVAGTALLEGSAAVEEVNLGGNPPSPHVRLPPAVRSSMTIIDAVDELKSYLHHAEATELRLIATVLLEHIDGHQLALAVDALEGRARTTTLQTLTRTLTAKFLTDQT